MKNLLLVLLSLASLSYAEAYIVEEYGNSQTGRIETILEDQLMVRVTSNAGDPQVGVEVVFETYRDLAETG